MYMTIHDFQVASNLSNSYFLLYFSRFSFYFRSAKGCIWINLKRKVLSLRGEGESVKHGKG